MPPPLPLVPLPFPLCPLPLTLSLLLPSFPSSSCWPSSPNHLGQVDQDVGRGRRRVAVHSRRLGLGLAGAAGLAQHVRSGEAPRVEEGRQDAGKSDDEEERDGEGLVH